MGKIVAIGGGEIGRPGYPVETLAIDKRIVELTGKKNPKVLLIPTASKDSELYYPVVQKHFGERLGCKVDVLYLIRDKLSIKEIRRKILSTDIVYVGGGDTGFMLRIWRKKRVDKILKEAYEKGIVLSGVSAGAICWFKYGSSDTKKFKDEEDKRLTRLSCLGLVNLTVSPHHTRELHRKIGIIEIMKRTSGVAVALDDNCALEIVDGKYRVISSKEESNAHKVYYKGSKLVYVLIPKEKDFSSLSYLLSKQ
ncbi:MAG: Type 1 glutamine amidotransferase-like domain-containing protein [Nanoarchaeota archaeon]|nr:Type 1 glutamine amidotransferase-like domain-containing protein [Nanoarchaeota archaeon]